MEPVIFNLPDDATVLFNHLHYAMTPAELDSDLVAIELPNDRVIDVSWSPAHKPIGKYTVTVFRESWENQEYQVEADSIAEVKQYVEFFAAPRQPIFGFSTSPNQNATSASTVKYINITRPRVRQNA